MKLSLTWVDAVALALAKYGGKAHLNRLYDDAPRIYGRKPATFESLVRQTVESHSSDSENFGENGLDLFASTFGIGEGVWSLRNANWTIGDVITTGGQFHLLTEVIQAYPSSTSGHANPYEKLKAANLIEFAQQFLPGLPLWRKAV